MLLTLPEVVVMHALTFLSGRDVALTRRTCKWLARLASDNIIWQEIYLARFSDLSNWRSDNLMLS